MPTWLLGILIAILVFAVCTYPHWSYKQYYIRMKKGTKKPFEGGKLHDADMEGE